MNQPYSLAKIKRFTGCVKVYSRKTPRVFWKRPKKVVMPLDNRNAVPAAADETAYKRDRRVRLGPHRFDYEEAAISR
jgi:hypothetical protein